MGRTADFSIEYVQQAGTCWNSKSVVMQVSELSHKLGTSEGNCKSLEEELARLQAQHVLLSKVKSEREVDANDSRAKLHAAEEKVCQFRP